MKILKITIILLFVFQNILFMQDKILGGTKEIYLRTFNISEIDTIYFNIFAVGSVWAWSELPPYNISDNYNGYSLLKSECLIIGNYAGWEKGWETLVPGGSHEPPYFSHGLYKFYVKKGYNSKPLVFYINFRDSDWNGLTYPAGNDIYINFDSTVNNLSINWGLSHLTTNVFDGQLFYFWKEKGKESCSTINFENFWQNCLVAIPEEDSDSNLFYIPHLVWGPKPNYTANGYKFYRSQNNNNNYQLLEIINNAATFEFSDDSLNSTDTSKYYYRVTA